MRNDRRASWLFGVGVAAGTIAGLAIGRRSGAHRMPHLNAWQRTLAEQWGEAAAAMLASRVLAQYQVLYARRPCLAQRASRLHLERNILPGLALYQVLLEETGTQEDALAEVEDLFEVTLTKKRSSLPPLRCLPDPCCFYLNVLAAYGAPELMAIFCKPDLPGGHREAQSS